MWCFQGLEAMGRTGTGTGARADEWLLVLAGVGPIDCHAAPEQSGWLFWVSRRCHMRMSSGATEKEGEKKNIKKNRGWRCRLPSQLAGGRAWAQLMR
jgi:hypothetical protein